MSLEPKLEKRLRAAIRHFWKWSDSQALRQGGTTGMKDTGARSAVTGGAQMNGFVGRVRDLLCESRLNKTEVYCENSIEVPR